jgi:hypothetical protein
VVLFSPTLFAKQVRGIEHQLAKRRRPLRHLQAKVRRAAQPGARGRGYTPRSLKTAIEKLLHGQHLKTLLRWDALARSDLWAPTSSSIRPAPRLKLSASRATSS